MKLTIVLKDENREIDCDNVKVIDKMLYVEKRRGSGVFETVQIWNMNNIIGVEMD